ncbi:hypothetical protein DSO57_1027086 [Entomophthora muscae]|uniref:Uncharacterized protein n=1 Tax=Entomophthora muscae TaxID=34485 RepID=A0ACC2T240_9FUNG|nr:hypothetical protein DSO57_1027086 [Entomophthora muscae]
MPTVAESSFDPPLERVSENLLGGSVRVAPTPDNVLGHELGVQMDLLKIAPRSKWTLGGVGSSGRCSPYRTKHTLETSRKWIHAVTWKLVEKPGHVDVFLTSIWDLS